MALLLGGLGGLSCVHRACHACPIHLAPRADLTVVPGGKEESKLLSFLTPQYNFSNRGSLTFEPLTLVPIQTKMIDVDSLTDKEVTRESWGGSVGAGESYLILFPAFSLLKSEVWAS